MAKGRSPDEAKNFRRANPGRVCRTCFYLESVGGGEFICSRPGEIVFDSEVDTLLYVCDGFKYPDDASSQSTMDGGRQVTVGELKPFFDSLKSGVSAVTKVRMTPDDTDAIPFEITDIDFHPEPGLVWVTMESLGSVPVPKRYRKRRVACDKDMAVWLVEV